MFRQSMCQFLKLLIYPCSIAQVMVNNNRCAARSRAVVRNNCWTRFRYSLLRHTAWWTCSLFDVEPTVQRYHLLDWGWDCFHNSQSLKAHQRSVPASLQTQQPGLFYQAAQHVRVPKAALRRRSSLLPRVLPQRRNVPKCVRSEQLKLIKRRCPEVESVEPL